MQMETDPIPHCGEITQSAGLQDQAREKHWIREHNPSQSLATNWSSRETSCKGVRRGTTTKNLNSSTTKCHRFSPVQWWQWWLIFRLWAWRGSLYVEKDGNWLEADVDKPWTKTGKSQSLPSEGGAEETTKWSLMRSRWWMIHQTCPVPGIQLSTFRPGKGASTPIQARTWKVNKWNAQGESFDLCSG